MVVGGVSLFVCGVVAGGKKSGVGSRESGVRNEEQLTKAQRHTETQTVNK